MTLQDFTYTPDQLKTMLLAEIYEDRAEMVATFNDFFASPISQLTLEDLEDITDTEFSAAFSPEQVAAKYAQHLTVTP